MAKNNPDITDSQKKELIQNVVKNGSGETVIKKYGGLEKVEEDANKAVKTTYPNQSGYYVDGTKKIILPDNL